MNEVSGLTLYVSACIRARICVLVVCGRGVSELPAASLEIGWLNFLTVLFIYTVL